MRYLIYDNVHAGAGIGHTFYSYHWGYKLAKLNDLDLNSVLVNSSVRDFNVYGSYERFFGLDVKNKKRQQILDDDTIKKVIVPSSKNKQDHHTFIQNYPYEDGMCFHVQMDGGTVGYNSCGEFDQTIDELKSRYRQARSNDHIESHIDKNYINVAIHIRRGNIMYSEKLREYRLCTDQSCIDTFNSFKQTTKSPIRLNIYTESRDGVYVNENLERSDIVDKFNHDNIYLYMDGSVLVSFDNIVNSDVIMHGNSAFSEVALALSDAKESYRIKNISGY